MKLNWIAHVIESFYYSGRVKVDRKLDTDDFLQYARTAHGSVMRELFKDQTRYGEVLMYYSQHMTRQTYTLEDKNSRGIRIVKLEEDKDILKLPNGVGIMSVEPIVAGKGCGCEDLRKAMPGMEWLLSGADFNDVPRFALMGNTIETRNVPECVKEVDVIGIHSDEDLDIPLDVAFDIVNMVLGVSLKVKGFPVDKTNNQNPNEEEITAALTQQGR